MLSTVLWVRDTHSVVVVRVKSMELSSPSVILKLMRIVQFASLVQPLGIWMHPYFLPQFPT